MRIFLDTANIDEIRHAARIGLISGVTTNPSLLAKEEGVSFKAAIQEICSIVPGPVSAEVIDLKVDGMLSEAREIATWAPNVVVKVPCSPAGFEAVAQLSKENIKTNMTLCFSVNQALLAATVGATMVSPFVGRLDDIGQDGMELIGDIVEVYRSYDIKTQVLAASIRHPLHCVTAAKLGADIATVPYKVLLQMMAHPLTDKGIERFLADWEKLRVQVG